MLHIGSGIAHRQTGDMHKGEKKVLNNTTLHTDGPVLRIEEIWPKLPKISQNHSFSSLNLPQAPKRVRKDDDSGNEEKEDGEEDEELDSQDNMKIDNEKVETENVEEGSQ